MKQIIRPSDSFESAAIAEDYPYGFRLRCKMAYWVEYRQGMGYRPMRCSTNPKKVAEVWNKPKAGTYHNPCIWVVRDTDLSTDNTDYLSFLFFPSHDNVQMEKAKEFLTEYGDQLTDEELKRIKAYILYQVRLSPDYYSDVRNTIITDGKLTMSNFHPIFARVEKSTADNQEK